MKSWEKEKYIQQVLNQNKVSQNQYHSRQKEQEKAYDDFDDDDNFDDNEEDGLYSRDEDELDQSFDDSDLQNKDPGKLI